MQSDNLPSTIRNNSKEHTPEQRKKRVHRMKTVIMVVVIILLLLPTLLCIMLGIHVSRLQKQVNDLISIHITDGTLLADTEGNTSYAYAANRQEEADGNSLEGNPEDNPSLSVTPGGDALGITGTGYGESLSDTAISGPGGTNDLSPVDGTTENNLTGDETIENNLTGDETIENDQQGDDITGGGLPGDEVDIPDEPGNTGSEPGNQAGDTLEIAGTEDSGGFELLGNPGNTERTADAKDVQDSQYTEETEAKTGIYAGKKVYLTFDDGPGKYTDDILDILSEYGVKATFFVIGKEDKASKKIYQRIVDEGHTLGMHSYSHVYKRIYNSLEDFDKDFTKLWKLLYDTTGYMPIMYRFPGGSYNEVNENGMDEFIKYLNEKSILYYDWNVVNGDATGEAFTKDQLINNVLKDVAIKKTPIVLMHDVQSKGTTVDSLPQLIETLLAGGAEVLPLTADVPLIQQIKADSIK